MARPPLPRSEARARRSIDYRDRAIANASYYLTPNQGEHTNQSAAQCWLRTALPVNHPNYLTREAVIELGFPDVTESWPEPDVRRA